jgi:hypothetical protein
MNESPTYARSRVLIVITSIARYVPTTTLNVGLPTFIATFKVNRWTEESTVVAHALLNAEDESAGRVTTPFIALAATPSDIYEDPDL